MQASIRKLMTQPLLYQFSSLYHQLKTRRKLVNVEERGCVLPLGGPKVEREHANHVVHYASVVHIHPFQTQTR